MLCNHKPRHPHIAFCRWQWACLPGSGRPWELLHGLYGEWRSTMSWSLETCLPAQGPYLFKTRHCPCFSWLST